MSEQGLPRTTAEIAERRGFRLRGRSIREHVARGVVINAGFMIGFSALSLLKGFVIATFLTQEDYGIWGIVLISLWTLLMLKEVGIGDKYIQQDEDDQEAAFQKAFTLELIWTGVFVVLLGAALPLVALVYDRSEVVGPGLVMIAVLPAGPLQTPIRIYSRRLEYLRARLLQGVDPVVSFAVSIALAIGGAGYWSLPLGILAGAWSAALAAVVFTPYRLRLRYDSGALRSYATFSWPLLLAVMATIALAQGSILTTNAILGVAAAGALTLATTITQFTDRVDYLVSGTLYPAICAVSDRLELLKESFVKSNRLALMWAMPFGFGLTLFAADLVNFVLGDEWRSVIVLLQVFGAVAAISHIGFNWASYFRVLGNTKPIGLAAFATMGIFLASVVPLLHLWELTGLAVAVAIQALVHMICRAYFLARLFEGFEFLRHALRATLPTLPPVALVLLLRLVESGDRTPLMAGGELALYAVTTVAATVAMEGPLLREAIGYLRRRPAVGVTG